MAASVAPPQFDPSTSDASRAGAAAYLASRLQPTTTTTTPFTIPTIDLGPSFSNSPAARLAVAQQIHAACTTSGFFTITNHGIAPKVVAGVLQQAKRFFHELDAEKREALHMRHSALHRGYEPPAYTSIDGSAETKAGFNWGYEERLRPASFADDSYDGGYVELDGRRYPDGSGNLWPREEDLPGFFDGVKAYYGEAMGLARHLMGLFGLALGLGEGYFDKSMTHPGGIARLLYYPPGKEVREQSEQDIGLGAHSDYECFTILLPSGTPGLEVLSPAGQWTAVERVDGGLIVNIADFLMRWTNDMYRSTVHRVVNRSTREPRYSVPLFFSVNYDEVVETLPSCITPANPAKYGPIRAGEYVLERLNTSTAGGKGSYGNTDWAADEKK